MLNWLFKRKKIVKKFLLSLIKNSYIIQKIFSYIRPKIGAKPKIPVQNSSFAHKNTKIKNILIATSTGSNWTMSGFERVISEALSLRNNDVHVLLCDEVLPACSECNSNFFSENKLKINGPIPPCNTCFNFAQKMYQNDHIKLLKYSDYLNEENIKEARKKSEVIKFDQIKNLTFKGIKIGEHVKAGVLRFFGIGDFSLKKDNNKVIRAYLEAAYLTIFTLEGLLKENTYEVCFFHHGIYIPQGIIGDFFRKKKIRVVNWHPAYKSSTFMFSHYDTYHKTMIDEPKEIWMNKLLTSNQKSKLKQYLNSRFHGGNDWISFQHQKNVDFKNYLKNFKIKTSQRKNVLLLTNVLWDAQLHFKQNAFSSMIEWLHMTIEYFIQNEDTNLIIRVHPAEVLGTVPSNQPIINEIYSKWKKLPKNIIIINPENNINTYSIMKTCKVALVYGTKMAIELAYFGYNVIVCGEAWARNKGFTIDISSKKNYLYVLNNLDKIKKLSLEKRAIAEKYAYYIFFNRMIPVKFAKKNNYLFPIRYSIKKLDELKPGYDKGLDLICNGIINGDDFIFD